MVIQLNKQTTVSHWEVDFSWPMLHSVCRSFNIQTFDMYLKDCWEKISQDEIGIHPINTEIHICSAHIMHRFSYKIERKLCNKPKKETKLFIIFLMARLISCTTLDELDQLFTSLCMLCFSSVRNKEIENYISKLENAILCYSDEEYELEMEYITQIDEELPNEIGDGLTYRKNPPLGSTLILSLKVQLQC